MPLLGNGSKEALFPVLGYAINAARLPVLGNGINADTLLPVLGKGIKACRFVRVFPAKFQRYYLNSVEQVWSQESTNEKTLIA